MSAFLAPIHFWMYDKVQLQEQLIQYFAAAAAKEGWDLGGHKAEEFIVDDDRPLDELIDTDDIHGWLSGRIDDVEGRYAAFVQTLLEHNEGLLPKLVELAREFGAQKAVEAGSDGNQIYQAFNNTFLNGMPCDLAIKVVDKNPDSFTWQQVSECHGQYWKAVNGDPATYYTLREAILKGLMEKTGYTLKCVAGNTYTVEKA